MRQLSWFSRQGCSIFIVNIIKVCSQKHKYKNPCRNLGNLHFSLLWKATKSYGFKLVDRPIDAKGTNFMTISRVLKIIRDKNLKICMFLSKEKPSFKHYIFSQLRSYKEQRRLEGHDDWSLRLIPWTACYQF